MYLIFDIETTGLIPKNSSNSFYKYYQTSKYDNSRMIQISYEILDFNLNVIQAKSFYINEIDEINNNNIHGITISKIKKDGISFNDFIKIFSIDIKNITTLIAHNMQFDINILFSELYRYKHIDLLNIINNLDHKCSMLLTTDIVAIPGKFGKNKYPKLLELYNYSFNTQEIELRNSHNSKFDVEYLRLILIELKNKRILNIFL